MEKFKHVKPQKEHERQAIEYINEFYKYNSKINGVGGLDKYLDNYSTWLQKLDEDIKREPTEERVPSETFFLIRKKDNKIVGMINIRLALNENLKRIGGHIGYSIRPEERKKGYNKINLYLGLKECQKHGIKEVLMDCDKDNIGSAKTMQALNGILIKEWYDKQKDRTIQYYIIDVDKSLENNKEKYEVFIEE